MAPVTAHILVSTRKNAPPSHILFLMEGAVPKWVMVPSGFEDSSISKTVWTCNRDKILEDGLLMIALCIQRLPRLTALTQRSSLHDPIESHDLRTVIAQERLSALRNFCRRANHSAHLVITILGESTAMHQARILTEYRFSMEVCTWRYSRIKAESGFDLAMTEDHPFLDNPYSN